MLNQLLAKKYSADIDSLYMSVAPADMYAQALLVNTRLAASYPKSAKWPSQKPGDLGTHIKIGQADDLP